MGSSLTQTQTGIICFTSVLQIIELQEATQIHSGLQSGSLSHQTFINEVKLSLKHGSKQNNIIILKIKMWQCRNHLPNHFDDLSYWNDVFLWREQHFRSIIKAYDASTLGEHVLLF